MISRRMAGVLQLAALAVVIALACGPLTAHAGASGLEWRLEQPKPPPAPAGVPGSETPVGLGRVSDIEFSAPNRGLLITAGNGSTVPAGIWDYNGEGWHELASQCGATDGRIAWVGPASTQLASQSTPEEFWTISDGRPGQAANGLEELPPLADNTLCHFAPDKEGNELEVVGSYASLAFQASSYQPMQAAACASSSDCWFAGAPLPEPLPGAFQLHWSGSSLEAEPNTRAHAIRDMRAFGGNLFESLELPEEIEPEEIEHPRLLSEIEAEAASTTFEPLLPRSSVTDEPLPEYAPGSFPQALGPLVLATDENSLWAAAGPLATPPVGSTEGELTVLRFSGGEWNQVLGAEEDEAVEKADPASLAKDVVSSLAAEPGTAGAWLATQTPTEASEPSPTDLATVARVVAARGPLAEEVQEQLPSAQERSEGVGPKGSASKIACPAQNDCWMVTSQGWLFHLSEAGARTLPADTASAFNGPLITFRPPDKGLPQVQSDALAVDDSGEEESPPASTGATIEKAKTETFARVEVPLLSHERTRLVHGTTLELSFQLAVKARVRLLAKRHKSVVASTSTRTLKAGRRSLELALNVHRWPTKLELQTHALARLPTESTLTSGVETVSTSLAFPRALSLPNLLGQPGTGQP
jgi:hypothetical protein